MKAMRYIWIVLGLLSVVAVEAATYGKPYQPQYQCSTAYSRVHSRTEMPITGMSSVGSSTMYSGSALPLAAATGVTSSEDNPSISRAPRRATMDDYFGDETVDDTQNPLQPGTPIGDAVLPLMLMAMLFAGFVALRRRKAAR